LLKKRRWAALVFQFLLHYYVQNFYSATSMKITKTTIQTLLDKATSLRADDFYEVADVLKHHDDDSIALDSVAFLPVISFCFANKAIALKIRRFSWANARENLAYGLLSAGNSTVEKVLKILKEHNLLTKKNYKRLVDTQEGQSKLQLLASFYVQLDNALKANDVYVRHGDLSDFIVQLAVVPHQQLSEFLASLVALSKCRCFVQKVKMLAESGDIHNPLYDAQQVPLSPDDITVLITNYAAPAGAAVPLTECITHASDLGLSFPSLNKLMKSVIKEGAAAQLHFVNSAVRLFLADDVSHQLQRDILKLAFKNMRKLSGSTITELKEVSLNLESEEKNIKGIIVNGKLCDASIARLGLFDCRDAGIELPTIDLRNC
jgi:hypothetical protein